MANNHPLARYRAANGALTQEALGKELGVTGVTVSRWESGVRMPDKDLLPQISKITGISAKELRPDLAELMNEAAE